VLNYDLNSSEKEFELLDTEYHGQAVMNNPFPGLRPFGVDECHLFFGREGQVDEILVKLSENRFVTLLGYSGSGKSSLMYCGIIPILYGGFMTDTGADWNIVVTRPGYSPLDNLAESLIQHDPEYSTASEEDKLIKRTIASAILRGGSAGLIDIARQYKRLTGDNLLILVDQFEELFRFKEIGIDESNEASAFIRLLLEAVECDDVPIYVAVTMRSDFIGDCAQYPGLTDLINKSSYVIPQMSRDQKRMAIEGPVAVGGGRIASRLVKRLLKEIGDNQDQLPIMQHALMRTWDYWVENREKGEELDFRHYNAVGKISEALSLHADEAYDQLAPDHKRVAEVLFKSLTEKGADNDGIRRPSTIREVAKVAAVDESIVIDVVEHFRQPGLSLLMPPANIELYSDSIVEISHESLMRIWIRLKNWVDEESESAEMYMRISEAAALYQIGRTGLWRPPDLQLALNWQKKQKPTRYWAQRYDEAFERAIVFLDTSRITYEAEQENQEQLQKAMLLRARRFAGILGVAAILAIMVGIWAILQRQTAITNEIAATVASEEAIAAQADAEEQRGIAQDQTLVAEKNLKTAQAAAKAEAAANLKLTNALVQTEQSRQAAVFAEAAAVDAQLLAEDATLEAKAQTVIAVAATKLAQDRLMLSYAQSLAGRSLQERDVNLRAIMAQQAYIYNSQFGGAEFDNMIYDALYYSVEKYEGEEYNMFKGHKDAVKSVEFSSFGSIFFSTGSDGKINQWNVDDNKQAPQLINSGEVSSYTNRTLKVSPDNKWLLVTSDTSFMRLYDMNNLTAKPAMITGHSGFVRDAAFMPDNSGIYSVGSDGSLRFYDFNRLRLQKQLQYPIYSIKIDPAGEYLYGGTSKGDLIRIKLSDMTQEVITSLEGGGRIAGMDISNDGQYLAYGGQSGYVVLYDLTNNVVVKELHGHTARVNAVAFSNNGSRLASASWDGTIELWNLEELDDLPYLLKEHLEAYAWDLTFSPDDEYLVVGTSDGSIKKWAIDNATVADQICQYVSRNMTKEEWDRYLSDDVDYVNTCKNLPGLDNI